MCPKEIYVPIKNYEEFYNISNFGNIFSKERIVKHNWGGNKKIKSRLLKPIKNYSGYYEICLWKNGVGKRIRIHRLVWEHFGDSVLKNNLQIDHINADKSDNRISNLQLLSPRENTNKMFKDRGKLLPEGVHFYKPTKKFVTGIVIRGKFKHLGYFETAKEAAEKYKNFLSLEGL